MPSHNLEPSSNLLVYTEEFRRRLLRITHSRAPAFRCSVSASSIYEPLCEIGDGCQFLDRYVSSEVLSELVVTIRGKGARLAVPGIVDQSEIAADAQGVAKIVLESVQEMLLKLALQIARDDFEDRRERQRQGIDQARANGKYTGRHADAATHERIVALRTGETALLAPPSWRVAAKRVWAEHRRSVSNETLNAE